MNKNEISMPLITIITVTYNAENYIEETIKSILSQTYKNIEYIIIDGSSQDNTLKIIKKYENRIHRIICEKDKGIYDAMNKGISSSSGKWLNFMNAGDIFYSDNVLEKIFLNNKFSSNMIIYGNVQIKNKNKNKILKANNILNMNKGSQFCHQSSFIPLELHKELKYNINNRIGADFEFFYYMYKKYNAFYYIDTVISSISSGGLSDIKRIDSIVSWWNVVEKDFKTNIYFIFKIINEILKSYIKKYIR